MIQRVNLKNYGPFARANLVMTPMTVVVGPNASGKSKLLEVLRQVGGSNDSQVRQRFLEKNLRRGAFGIEISIKTSAEKSNWRVVPSDDDSQPIFHESGRVHLEVLLLSLNPDLLRTPSYIDSSEPFMRDDGYGLATTLAFLKLNDVEAFDRLLERTRKIVPTFEDLRFRRSRVPQTNSGDIYGDELIFDMKGAPDLPPDAVSDGTLLTLGLLTSTMVYSRSHAGSASLLFLIDDLEHGLHPRALGELVAQLRGLTKTSGIQILATSHSPYLLDALRPEEVRLTGFLEDGSSTIRSLADHPDFERWKDEMTPGEMWSLVGEDWIR